MTLHFKVKLLALRLLSNHYRNNVDGQSPSEFFSQFKLLPTEMMDAAQQAFPYYRREQLEEIFLGLINLGREHLPFDQLYSFITEKQFRRSIESITSNVLMHFVPGNFVEKVLLKMDVSRQLLSSIESMSLAISAVQQMGKMKK
ncbi:MAG: hypothetical protein PHI99_01550 [Syntrophales bacterium]|nr:hypothetical protein [Syntrophales bacterium]